MSETAAIRRHVLEDGGTRVAILNLGCITQDWRVLHDGDEHAVVLGLADPDAYRANPWFMGAIVGRLAGRVGGAGFDLDGAHWALPANEPPHHLHGGPRGLSTRIWKMDPDGARAVVLRLTSAHGDQGYPGRLDLLVRIALDGDCLSYDMQALSDRPTPLSLAQHSYYALGGALAEQVLTLPASDALVTSHDLVASGARMPVGGTAPDFRAPRAIGSIGAGVPLDLCYVLDHGAARLTAPNGLTLTMETDQPCLQLYTGHHLGAPFAPFAGLCLEPQGWPNALNAGFPAALVTPDRPYRQRLSVRIAGRP